MTFNRAAVETPIAAACAPYGITCRCTANEHPVYMDKNGKVVQAMVGLSHGAGGGDGDDHDLGIGLPDAVGHGSQHVFVGAVVGGEHHGLSGLDSEDLPHQLVRRNLQLGFHGKIPP